MSPYADRNKELLALINDLPTPKDFFDSGIELFDFAWDTVANLVTNLSQAIEMGGRGEGRHGGLLGSLQETINDSFDCDAAGG